MPARHHDRVHDQVTGGYHQSAHGGPPDPEFVRKENIGNEENPERLTPITFPGEDHLFLFVLVK